MCTVCRFRSRFLLPLVFPSAPHAAQQPLCTVLLCICCYALFCSRSITHIPLQHALHSCTHPTAQPPRMPRCPLHHLTVTSVRLPPYLLHAVARCSGAPRRQHHSLAALPRSCACIKQHICCLLPAHRSDPCCPCRRVRLPCALSATLILSIVSHACAARCSPALHEMLIRSNVPCADSHYSVSR